MRKQFIQQSNSQKRAKNFFDTITSDDTLQIIVGQDNRAHFCCGKTNIIWSCIWLYAICP